MKEIIMPTSPNFVRSVFTLQRAVGAVASPFTGQTRTQEFDYVGWVAQVTLPPLKRPEASAWTSFLTMCEGPTNFFKFIDPDGRDPAKNRNAGEGTYSGDYFKGDARMSTTGKTLTFAGNTVTSTNGNAFSAVAGDYFFVSGAINDDNNGTFKIVDSVSNSATVAVTDRNVTSETSTANCKVQSNVKGSTGLLLDASTNSAVGLLKAGDYLAIRDGTGVADTSIQLVMCTENATEINQSGSENHYAVGIQPKLRQDLPDNYYVGFQDTFNTTRFRMMGNEVGWDTNHNSLYTLTFTCAEVI